MNVFRFVDFNFINALFVYRRTDGYGERISACSANLFFPAGLVLFVYTSLIQFTGPLNNLWERMPVIYKSGYLEGILIIILSALILYYALYKRIPDLEVRYAILEKNNSKWIVALGMLNQALFVGACAFGLTNYWFSFAFVALLISLQEVQYRLLMVWLLKKV